MIARLGVLDAQVSDRPLSASSGSADGHRPTSGRHRSPSSMWSLASASATPSSMMWGGGSSGANGARVVVAGHRTTGSPSRPAGSSSAASPSSSSGSLARLLTVSPSSSLISRTPWVLRPMVRIVLDAGADDHAAAGREHDLVVVGDLGDGDDRPVALAGLDVDQALAAAVLGAVLGQQGPLAVALGADGQEAGRVVVAVGHDHADDLVALGQVDPLDAVGRPAHRADPALVEPDRHAVPGAEHDVVARLDAGHADQLIVLVESQGDDPAPQGPAEGRPARSS